ncbi:transmembrane protein 170 [Trichinella spiralis]|uniref:transmembrane protein 170 n=1 Tax=Trichinella spiralis TaxID=6334 RepID=UPI0001EFC0C4|nr:transmembrane protein 170 [Trichinella spiralis]
MNTLVQMNDETRAVQKIILFSNLHSIQNTLEEMYCSVCMNIPEIAASSFTEDNETAADTADFKSKEKYAKSLWMTPDEILQYIQVASSHISHQLDKFSACLIAVVASRRHRVFYWYDLVIILFGAIGPITWGSITSATIAWTFYNSSQQMPALYALVTGVSQSLIFLISSLISPVCCGDTVAVCVMSKWKKKRYISMENNCYFYKTVLPIVHMTVINLNLKTIETSI